MTASVHLGKDIMWWSGLSLDFSYPAGRPNEMTKWRLKPGLPRWNPLWFSLANRFCLDEAEKHAVSTASSRFLHAMQDPNKKVYTLEMANAEICVFVTASASGKRTFKLTRTTAFCNRQGYFFLLVKLAEAKCTWLDRANPKEETLGSVSVVPKGTCSFTLVQHPRSILVWDIVWMI